MTKVKRMFIVLTSLSVVAMGAHSIQNVRSQQRLDNLLSKDVVEHQDNYDPAKEPARKARAWRLYKLWLMRGKRDVTAQVVPFLRDEYRPLRLNAVCILGRTESRVATSHLQQLQAAAQQKKTILSVDVISLRIATARNSTRGLKGQTKFAAFAKELGLSVEEMALLSKQLHAERLKGRGTGSRGEKIVKEMVDMLYTMSKKGQNIQPLVNRLTLLPAQKVLLQGARLPPAEEAKRIVEYLSNLNTVTPSDEEAVNLYLPCLGTYGTQAVVQRLSRTKGGRVQLGKEGRSALIDALRWNNDTRSLTLLATLKKSDDPWVRRFATKMPDQIKLLGHWSSPFSPRPPMMGLILQERN